MCNWDSNMTLLNEIYVLITKENQLLAVIVYQSCGELFLLVVIIESLWNKIEKSKSNSWTLNCPTGPN